MEAVERTEEPDGDRRSYDIMIPFRCANLTIDFHGRAACKLHGTAEKPAICRREPSSPAMLEEGCGFRFEERR